MALQPGLLFFTRNSLIESDRHVCHEWVRKSYPSCLIKPSPFQGYCSYTLLLSASDPNSDSSSDTVPIRIIQFRPVRYSLDVSISAAAKSVYGDYAPTTVLKASLKMPQRTPSLQAEHRTLLLYEIEKIPGVPYNNCCIQQSELSTNAQTRQDRLVRDFARFIARGWALDPYPDNQQHCAGKIGSTIQLRLQKLAHELPARSLRSHAQKALQDLHALQDLPVVLTHGDVVPSNIMVDPDSRRLQGLVDWAEAEYLPFGMCLYGLEYLLGYVPLEPPNTFRYYTCAADLRLAFWDEMGVCIPSLRCSRKLQSAVALSKDVGVLLWQGFAWDDGAIARVINAEDDASELMFLHAWLGSGHSASFKL